MSLRDLDGTGFATAARVWSAYRHGTSTPTPTASIRTCPTSAANGFLFDEVIYEIAHRFGDELLLWDGWGRITGPCAEVTEEDAAWLDGVAALLLAADDGDLDAEAGALSRYRADAGLHPGPTIVQASPFGDPPVDVTLAAKLTAHERRRRPAARRRPLAVPAGRRVGADPRHPPAVDAGRRQGAHGADADHEPLVERAALRDRPWAHHVTRARRGRGRSRSTSTCSITAWT